MKGLTMPAQNKRQIEEQIGNFKAVCTKVVECQNAIFQLLEHEEVVNQNWGNLGTDFPSMVDADGVVGEDFAPNHINQAKTALGVIAAVLQGTQATAPTGNLGRNVRRLTRGITA